MWKIRNYKIHFLDNKVLISYISIYDYDSLLFISSKCIVTILARIKCRWTKTVANRRLNLCRDSHNFASSFSFSVRAFYICTVTAPTVLLMHKNKHRAQIGPRNEHEYVRTLFKCTVLINIFLHKKYDIHTENHTDIMRHIQKRVNLKKLQQAVFYGIVQIYFYMCSCMFFWNILCEDTKIA